MLGNIISKMTKALESQLSHLRLHKKVLLPFRISEINAITLYVLPNSPGGELDASTPPPPAHFSSWSVEPSLSLGLLFLPYPLLIKRKKKGFKEKQLQSCEAYAPGMQVSQRESRTRVGPWVNAP